MDQFEKTALLRDIILNTRKPLVIQKFSTNWKCFDCSIEEWCKRFDGSLQKEETPQFEQMPTRYCDTPQWERYRSKLSTTFTNFLHNHSNAKENWTAFYYEPSSNIPIECRHDIDFGFLGFPKRTNDVSFWLSSKGANTPCHFDTYGCNIVIQVYGRENAFACILEEGDALIVPRNWWHYVETLETSLSVNTWIPLKIDIDAQIQECIVKYIVETSISQEPEEKKSYILNPNQLHLTASSDELFEILNILIKNKSNVHPTDEKYSYEYLPEAEVNKLIESCHDDVSFLELLTPNEFDIIMSERTKRYTAMDPPDKYNIHPIHEALLNAICHPNSINKIKDEFLKKIK